MARGIEINPDVPPVDLSPWPTHLIHKAGFSLKDAATGAVTLIQRFGSALNLNIHFHILFLDGVYVYRDNRPPRFQRVKAPDKGELEELVQLISQRVGRCLPRERSECFERQGLLEQDTESAWLDLDPAEDTDATPIKRGGPCHRFWAVPSPTA
jgi:hypothetical protein